VDFGLYFGHRVAELSAGMWSDRSRPPNGTDPRHGNACVFGQTGKGCLKRLFNAADVSTEGDVATRHDTAGVVPRSSCLLFGSLDLRLDRTEPRVQV
jgi:hypothetical protein